MVIPVISFCRAVCTLALSCAMTGLAASVKSRLSRFAFAVQRREPKNARLTIWRKVGLNVVKSAGRRCNVLITSATSLVTKDRASRAVFLHLKSRLVPAEALNCCNSTRENPFQSASYALTRFLSAGKFAAKSCLADQPTTSTAVRYVVTKDHALHAD